MALALTRDDHEKVTIGDDVVVTVIMLPNGKVRLAVQAPRDVRVMRAERNRAQPFGQPEDLEPAAPPWPQDPMDASEWDSLGALAAPPRTGVCRPAFPVLPPEAHDIEPDGPGIPAADVFGPLLAQCHGPAYHGDPGDEPHVVPITNPGLPFTMPGQYPAKPADDDQTDPDDDTDELPLLWPAVGPPGGG